MYFKGVFVILVFLSASILPKRTDGDAVSSISRCWPAGRPDGPATRRHSKAAAAATALTLAASKATGPARRGLEHFLVSFLVFFVLLMYFFTVFVFFIVLNCVFVLYSVFKGVLVLYSVFKCVLRIFSVF